MISAPKKCCLLVILCCTCYGCLAQVPQSDRPVELERVFHGPFDSVWSSALEVVRMSHGNMITKDRASGLIIYHVFDRDTKCQLYINLFLKKDADMDSTVVYFIQRTKDGHLGKPMEKEFFQRLGIILEES